MKGAIFILGMLLSMAAYSKDLYTSESGLAGLLTWKNSPATVMEFETAPYSGTNHLRVIMTGVDRAKGTNIAQAVAVSPFNMTGRLLRLYLKAEAAHRMKIYLFSKGKTILISPVFNLTTSYAPYDVDSRIFASKEEVETTSSVDYILFILDDTGSFTATLDIGKISVVDP